MKNIKKIKIIAAVSFCFILPFQNCSDVGFDQGQITLESKGLRSVRQTIQVQSNLNVDILFVVDNSASMAQEQVDFAAKLNGFLNLIDGLNWRIALTTTDPNANTRDANNVLRPWGDGQFRPFDSDEGSLFVLDAATHPVVDAQVYLANAIQVGIRGGGDESGIRATYRAIERDNGTFFRDTANLVVILISDEDECSNGGCLNNRPQSVPENLIDLVTDRFLSSKVFSFNSIIRMPNDATCTTGTVGNQYNRLSELTGGIIGSVCATDYTSILAGLGQGVQSLVRSANLDCEPVDFNNDGKPDVSVRLSTGERITDGFEVNGRRITFADFLPEGVHTVNYICEKDLI